jgi:hypothetical protein
MFKRRYYWFSLVFEQSDKKRQQVDVRFRHKRLGYRRIEVLKNELGLEPGAILAQVVYRGKMTQKQWEQEF